MHPLKPIGKNYACVLMAYTAFIMLSACNHDAPTVAENQSDASLEATWMAVPVENPTPIQKVEQEYPQASQMSLQMTGTGNFHEEEVSASMAEQKWMGLFLSDERQWYISATELHLSRVYDPVADDEESQRSGWHISTSNKDSCLLLVVGTASWKEGEVPVVPIQGLTLYPGDSIVFEFQSISYKMEASGRKMTSETGEVTVEDYRLFLYATIDGQEQKVLLAAQPTFNENMIQVMFAGDMDGDGRLDLLLDTSSHYNNTQPTLYLSKAAPSGELIAPVGFYSATGC